MGTDVLLVLSDFADHRVYAKVSVRKYLDEDHDAPVLGCDLISICSMHREKFIHNH